jgi:hypothetical protein
MADVEVDGFLADSVTAVQGKLYALGLGWNRIYVTRFPARHDRVGVGLLFRIAARAPSRRHHFELRIEGPDGEMQLGSAQDGRSGGRLGGDFTAGASDEQIIPIALNLNGVPLATPGDYRFVVMVDGADVKLLPFRVESRPSAAPAEQAGTGTAGYL